MVTQTVEAVRQAELTADETVKKAEEKCRDILKKAEQDAEEMISSMTIESLAKSKEYQERAQRQGEAFMDAAQKRADKERARLGKIAEAKKQEAVMLVISEIT